MAAAAPTSVAPAVIKKEALKHFTPMQGMPCCRCASRS